MPALLPTPEELDIVHNAQTALAVRLYKNLVNYTPATVEADIHEADFNGYEASDPAPFEIPDVDVESGRAECLCAPLTYTKKEGPIGNMIYGYTLWINTTAGAYLVGVYPFPKPFNMMELGNTFTFLPKFQVTNETNPF